MVRRKLAGAAAGAGVSLFASLVCSAIKLSYLGY
jgi:hypothetical protein